MKQRAWYLAPWIVTAVFITGSATNLWLNHRSGVFLGDLGEGLTLGAALLAFAVLGSVVISREPRNGLGWTLAAVGVVGGLFPIPEAYATYLVVTTGEVTAAVIFGAWWNSWYWFLLLGLVFVYVPMLYPTGRFLSRRWGWFTLVPTVAMLAMMVLGALSPEVGLQEQEELRAMGISPIVFDNPLGVGIEDPEESPVGSVALGAFLAGMLGSVISLGVRYKRSRGEERLQMKWFAFVAALMPVMMLTEDVPVIGTIVGVVGWVGFPAAIGVAILKYRLYDIDVVISKTVVFAGLAAFITAIYVSIVVGVGTLLGAGGEPNLALSIVATAVVAVAFQPVREKLTRVANRLVFGKRATPYEVLSRFSSHMGETVATEDTLARMAQLLADGTGAAHAQVSLLIGGTLVPAASVGQVADASAEAHTVDVTHHGELLGALSVTKKRGESLTPADVKLVDDLAAQAGLLLRNVRLTEELKQRIVDLRASRQRLVAAQDAERRRLERDLHDGAQQQIVAMKLKLGIARTLAERENATRTAELVEQLTEQTDQAVQTLRELAHGIYPPLLAAEGLTSAITTAARRAPIPVTVHADEDLGRYDQDIEAAVYFCVLEALTNAAKYGAATATVTLTHHDGQLTFTVTDDGPGFDPTTTERGHGLTNMTDRLDALGGELDVSTSPGAGTSVAGAVPVHVAGTVR